MYMWLCISENGQAIIRADDIIDIYNGSCELICGYCGDDFYAIIRLDKEIERRI